MLKPKKRHRNSLGAPTSLLAVAVIVMAAANQAQSQWTGPDGNNKIYYNSGNVGIGTDNPAQKLEVNGIIRQGVTNGISLGADGGRNRIVGSASAPEFQFVNASDAYANLGMRGASIGINYASVAPPTNGLVIEGNVGIGTSSPGTKLDVNGNIYVRDLVGTGTQRLLLGYLSGAGRTIADLYSRDQVGVLDLSLGDGSISTRLNGYGHSYFNGGNVGIGTANPYTKLQVAGGDISVDPGYGIRKAGDNWIIGYSTSLPGIAIGSGSGADQVTLTAGGYERVRVLTNGNVGIGTPTPGYKLDVNGDSHVTGNLTLTGSGNITLAGTINAKYQDVAEWVPAAEQLEAGTVVVLDSTKSNQVTSSSTSYDTRVAGVISAQPGISLGEKGDGKVLVATTGRVRVKVDASKSPIRIGDLLVTSDIPGVAMKSAAVNLGGVQIHRPGTLIGKALEPLETGSGEILVLLSLQ